MDVEAKKSLLHAETKLFIRQLQDLGLEFSGDELIDLELADLVELHRQLRDTLRTLGGFRKGS